MPLKMQEQTFIDSANWKESSTMYDNNYVEPQPGYTGLPVEQVSSGIMGLEENLQKASVRLPNFSLGEVTHNNFSDEVGIASDIQQQLNFESEQEYHSQMIRDVLQQQYDVCPGQNSSASVATVASSWEVNFHEMQELSLFNQQQQQNFLDQSHHISSYAVANNTHCTNATSTAYPPPPELLNLLQIPRCSVGTTTISFGSKKPSLDIFPILSGEMVDQNSRMYDPHLSFPPHSPCLRDMLHTLPHNFQLNPPKPYLGLDEKEAALQEAEAGRQFTNSILELKRDMSLSKGEARGSNHFATERQRREYLNEKYQSLRTLVPNPTKADRASIVGDAIEYIKELLRTVEEMKILVEEKKCGSGRSKRYRVSNDHEALESCSKAAVPALHCEKDQKILSNGSLRSTWLKRISKDGTHVDVRIVDNEVNIKLIQRKRRSCLLCVSLILHELHLEILHANGANIGEHYIFMFNTKIYEGSCEHAGSIATKLMEAVDRQTSYISNF
ncbi:transcription factor EAT1 isoform X1 [Cryptomeria japonica]|uniref:transcription factor EAT1 isoform X1 n=2 Tax=Cryptomeria japonica TaxID=3369 RepID=UPI0025AC6676|nr:transcription factor EAT1 isoform X1 [Cryptomeria japonica]